MTDTAIQVNNLGKCYEIYNNPRDRLKQFIAPRLQRLAGQTPKQYFREFWALKDVSFEVKKGETIGIIGRNGCGKSTLLQLICGTLNPTSGSVQTNGRVAALLELGSGFNPEFTGRENVYMNGAVLGLSKEEIDARFNDIAVFADIGDFIEQPIKTYSSGMVVRLAFAVAINVDPDILVIDEALAVGDMRFQQKCFRKMRSFKEKGKTIIFVTHDTGAVISFCERAIWLKDGSIHRSGMSEDVVKKYISYMIYDLETVEKEDKNSQDQKICEINPIDIENKDKYDDSISWFQSIAWDDVSQCESFGEGGAKITHVAFYNNITWEKVSVLEGGETVSFFVKLDVLKKIDSPGIGVRLTDRHGNHIFSITSYVDQFELGKFAVGKRVIKVTFHFPFIFNGDYSITTALSDGSQVNHTQEHWVNDACIVKVSNKNYLKHGLGILALPRSVVINSNEVS